MARRDANGSTNGSGGAAGGRSVPNAAFARNVVSGWRQRRLYEQLQDGSLHNPASLDPSWRDFFAEIADDGAAVATAAQGPRWKQHGWPVVSADELVSALDGNWADVETHISAKLKGESGEGVGLSPRTIFLRATRNLSAR